MTGGCGLIGSHVTLHLREAKTVMQEICSRSTPITQTDKTRQGDILLWWTDTRKGTQPLGWKPKTDLRTGFVRIFD